jgi:hypothetical protein
VPAVPVAIVDLVCAIAERFKTDDHQWLAIRLIRNTEQRTRD